jgi:alkylation response protein AidB-like acyl-CoA dehydrogenase
MTGSSLTQARERLAPVFAQIAESAVRHELEGTRPFRETRALADAGFGALRIAVDEGGSGLTVPEFFEILVELGAADSNQPQLWRNHIAFVEDRLAGEGDHDKLWRRRIADGAVIGGAWSEVGTASILGDTRLRRSGNRLLLEGTKYYSTGSIYSDHIGVLALTDDDESVIALVDARAVGVELLDDWSGFGQRATGSGTTHLRGAEVDPAAVLPFGERFVSQEAVYQLVLLAALAGVTRSVRDDAVASVRSRTRSYPHALAAEPRADAQLQQVIGRIAADAAAADALVAAGARSIDAVWEALRAGEDPTDAARQAAVRVYEAQITVAEAALRASTLLFDALGSSGVQRAAALDRHWRNARTLVSHNPRVYKERVVGDWYLNGADPLGIYVHGAANDENDQHDEREENDEEQASA